MGTAIHERSPSSRTSSRWCEIAGARREHLVGDLADALRTRRCGATRIAASFSSGGYRRWISWTSSTRPRIGVHVATRSSAPASSSRSIAHQSAMWGTASRDERRAASRGSRATTRAGRLPPRESAASPRPACGRRCRCDDADPARDPPVAVANRDAARQKPAVAPVVRAPESVLDTRRARRSPARPPTRPPPCGASSGWMIGSQGPPRICSSVSPTKSR